MVTNEKKENPAVKAEPAFAGALTVINKKRVAEGQEPHRVPSTQMTVSKPKPEKKPAEKKQEKKPRPAKQKKVPAVRKPKENVEVLHAAQSLTVPLKYISAALSVAPKDDVRYYMCGIYFHAVDGELRICATDGHRMLVSRYELEKGQRMPEWAKSGLIIPRSDLAQVLPIIEKHPNPTTHPEIVIEKVPNKNIVTVKSPVPFASFDLKPVDGKFPDYGQAIGHLGELIAGTKEREPLTATSIDPKFIRGVAEVASKLNATSVNSFLDGEKASLFTFTGAPDSILVVMPMRGGDAINASTVKLMGASSVNASVAALRAHITRNEKRLPSLSGHDKEQVENKVASLQERVTVLLEMAKDAPKQLTEIKQPAQ